MFKLLLVHFKIYYSFFLSRGKEGAEAALIFLFAPLSFNIYLVILFCLSYIVKISELGSFIFISGLMLVSLLVFSWAKASIVSNDYYQSIVIKHQQVNIVLGLFYFLISVINFPICCYILFNFRLPNVVGRLSNNLFS
jgi:hypothetical protein